MRSRLAGVLCALAVAACGGGDGVVPGFVASPAEGLWNGTTNTNRTLTGFVLDDGTTWVFYSAVNAPANFSGVIQGSATAQAGIFTSVNAADFNFDGLPVRPLSIAGTYVSRQLLNWVSTYSDGITTSTTTYNPAAEPTQALAVAGGTFNGTGAFPAPQGKEATTLVLSATTGALSGTAAGGCAFTGARQPRATGGVFNLTLTFGPAPCALPNVTVTGIAFFDVGNNRLYIAATNTARTAAMLFVGAKP